MNKLFFLFAFLLLGIVFSSQAQSPELIIQTGHLGAVYTLSLDPGENYLASGSFDATVKIWELATGKEIKTLDGHTGPVRTVDFSPDGKYLASGSDDHTIKLWDMESAKQIVTLRGHSSGVLAIQFSPSGERIISGSVDELIKIWDVETQREIMSWDGGVGRIESIDINSSYTNLAVSGEGGIKMSKSKGNVISPEQVIKEYGADTLRIYEMFMGPFEQTIAWDATGVKGARRFLEKVWRLAGQFLVTQNSQSSPDLKKLLHKTIKKVSEDIESLKFNTAVSSLMEFSNAWQADRKKRLGKKDFKDFLKVLSPFAPHLTQELWWKLDFKSSIHNQKWPKYDPTLIKEEIATFIIQVQGRVRGKIEAEIEISEEKLKKLALSQEKIKKWITGKKIKKTIFIPGRLINFVL
ncbi:MAG: class I tRNA ligase family protein [Bacteroidetes bacterium]|nr:class I tRNA ligase family protein [Bacteroidota bacterium]